MPVFNWLLGEPALSDFRKQRLSTRLSDRFGQLSGLEARFTYFVESRRALKETEMLRLQDLLHAGATSELDTTGLILVVPRVGTQSPWSSKATEIAGRCGLDTVRRLERGTAYWITGTGAIGYELALLAAERKLIK